MGIAHGHRRQLRNVSTTEENCQRNRVEAPPRTSRTDTPTRRVEVGRRRKQVPAGVGEDRADAHASAARALRSVEGEEPRFQFGKTDAVFWTRPFDRVLRPDIADQGGTDAPGEPHRPLDRLNQPSAVVAHHHEAIDHQLQGVLFVSFERDFFVECAESAVDPNPQPPITPPLVQLFPVLPLAIADHRRQDQYPLAFVRCAQAVSDVTGAAPRDSALAERAVRRAETGPEEPQVIEELSDRADGAARIAVDGLLIDAQRRGEPGDRVHLGPLHLAEELPRIGRQRLHEPPLPLLVERVEGQRRLPRTGDPRDHSERTVDHVDIDAAEVVLARAADADGVIHGGRALTRR